MGQIWRQSEVTQFFASVGRVIDQKWSKCSRSEENEKITVKSFTFLLQKINFTDQFYAPPVVMVTAERVNNDSHLSGCNAITAWVEVREETDWSTAYFTPV